MGAPSKKTRPDYDADIRFRCPEKMADALSAEAVKQQRDRSDVAREIFAVGLTTISRRRTAERARRVAR